MYDIYLAIMATTTGTTCWTLACTDIQSFKLTYFKDLYRCLKYLIIIEFFYKETSSYYQAHRSDIESYTIESGGDKVSLLILLGIKKCVIKQIM